MNKYDELKDWQTKYGFASPMKKLKLYYSPIAFAKTIQLVKDHPVEVGWNMTVKPYKDGYKVYDIYVYPQTVSAAYISVDLYNWGYWKATLDDEVEANLNGQGHSHVNMSPFASFRDEMNQRDEIEMKQGGFYLFQIWNKRNEINSFFYDIENMIYYENKDIEMIVEEVDSFVSHSHRLVTKRLIPTEVGEGFELEQIV